MDIIFWLDAEPVCTKGIYDEVAKQWDGNAYYVCSGKLDENRQKIQCVDNNEVKTVYLSEKSDKENFVDEFLKENIDAVHVFNGYKSSSSTFLDKLIKLNPNANIVVTSERYGAKGTKNIPIILYRLYYFLLTRKYKSKVKVFFVHGDRGVKEYTRIGWTKEKVFPFLYLPKMNENVCSANSLHSIIRFVYLGRFSAGGKGTDILMAACKYLKNSNYELCMVGGYGDIKDMTLAWIKSNPNAVFGGTWPINEACERLSEYDVCIVPSRYEGWNPTVNEALMAGVGCIVSDEAVSDELVTASKAGKVIKACDPKALAQAMDEVMQNPELVTEWHEKAINYRGYMSASVCAKYFIDVIDYAINKDETKARPMAPWQRK